MNDIWLVALFGGIGAVIRFALSKFSGALPWGILLANTVASALAAFYLESTFGLFVVVGLAGGLSTFSTLVSNTFDLWAKSKVRALANLALNLVVPSTAALAFGLLAASLLK